MQISIRFDDLNFFLLCVSFRCEEIMYVETAFRSFRSLRSASLHTSKQNAKKKTTCGGSTLDQFAKLWYIAMMRSSYIDGDSLTRIPIVKNERREIYIQYPRAPRSHRRKTGLELVDERERRKTAIDCWQTTDRRSRCILHMDVTRGQWSTNVGNWDLLRNL